MKHLVIAVYPTENNYEISHLIVPLTDEFLVMINKYREIISTIPREHDLASLSFFYETELWGELVSDVKGFEYDYENFISIMEEVKDVKCLGFYYDGHLINFKKTKKVLNTHQIKINHDGFWFICYDGDSGEEYATEDVISFKYLD